MQVNIVARSGPARAARPAPPAPRVPHRPRRASRPARAARPAPPAPGCDNDTVPTPVSAAELAALARACELAQLGAGTALPNPVVGCVLLDSAGNTVGEGFHERAGGPHAEIVALAAAGERARGATAVVTLEPCDHTGRTGPCSAALIAAGIARVVVAVRDPWPTAAGGMRRLRAAGVEVVDLTDAASEAPGDPSMTPPPSIDHGARIGGPADTPSYMGGEPTLGEIALAARDVNRVWLRAVTTARPFVTLKVAMSLDGRVAAPDGSSRWISSPQSRAHAHRMRGEIDAIMVGVGTVLADDPQLTARDESGAVRGHQPLRVIADSDGRTPPAARVRDGAAPTLIATAERFGRGPDGRVDLAAVTAQLYADGRRHLLVEGGPRLAAAFLDAGLVDEMLVYLAPLVLGAGRSAVEGGRITTLTQAAGAQLRAVRRLGPDLLLRYSLGCAPEGASR